MTIGEFLAMGGYARYVWPCFALAISVLLWNVWSARRYHAQALKRVQRAVAMAGSERS
jgi:heme exporter protein CcmD